MIKQSPLQYGFPFPKFRDGQRESIVAMFNSKSQYVIAQAPTGSGKSLSGAVLSKHKQTRTVTHTRNLIAQYEKIGSDAIYGMSRYPCHLVPSVQADNCLYSDKMTDCPVSSHCEYLRAKRRALASQFSTCSYAYYFLSRIKDSVPDILYLDEAHYLPDLLMNEYEIVITPKLVERFDADPIIDINPNHPQMITNKKMIIWLSNFHTAIFVALGRMIDEYNHEDLHSAIKIKRTKSLMGKIYTILSGIKSMPDMFIVFNVDNGMKITPLSSTPFFAPYFSERAGKVIMTSATIGNEKMFASLLGIGKKYEYINVPNRFTPQETPIYVSENSPRLSYQSGVTSYHKQIEILIGAMDKHYGEKASDISGLLHFSSKTETHKMKEILDGYDEFRGRIFVHEEELDTEGKVKQWEDRMVKHPNTIALSWCFHTGLDAPDIDMNVVMKTPFPAIDAKQTAMFKRNPKYYGWKTANTIEQAVGRTRRGDAHHYEVAGEPTRKLVMILDKNYRKVLSATSNHFKECITEL